MIKKLGDVLKERDLIDDEEILSAIRLAKQSGKKLGQVLLERGDLTEDDLLMALGDQLGFNIVSLGNYPIDQKVATLISREICEERMCVPLRLDENNVLHVAMKDVSNGDLLQYLKFTSGKQIAPCIALESEIIGTISRIYDFAASLEDLVSSVGKLTEMEFIDPERDADAAEARSFTITQIVKSVLVEAVAKGASDIHMEPSQTFLRVRVRIDGQLQNLINIPKWVQSQVIGCIKVQACLNIAEKRLPQDGKLSANIANRHIDFRVSTLPTPLGEKVVIRIQDKGKKGYTLSSLKLPPYLLKQILRLLQSDKGIILVTGPTGSGKTTLLYSMLTELVRKGPNIITVEDPIEFEFDGITQTQINEKAGMTFPTILRSILRQDPNVIMIGEIRDQQTAEIAFRAAQTGHLVLSTLHTNSAVSVVTRLKDLGIEPFLIASTVRGIFAQRLVRCNCPECIGAEDGANIADAAQKKLLRLLPAGTATRRGQGCEKCSNSGYQGRIGVYEYLKFTPAVVDAVNASLPEKQILQVAKADGAKTLADECVRLITEGITSFSECVSILTTQDVDEASGGNPGTAAQQSCPSCGKGVSAEFVVCPYCQHQLECKCPKCNNRVEREWQACPYCATRLGAPLADVAATQKSVVASDAATKPPPASKSPEPVAIEAVSVKQRIEVVETPAPREISLSAAVPAKKHAAPAHPRAVKVLPVEAAATVAAHVVSGKDAAASSRGVMPVAVPGQIVPTVIAGDAQAVLSFATPADNGASLTHYAIEVTHEGGGGANLKVGAVHGSTISGSGFVVALAVSGSNTVIKIGGLENGKVYGFSIVASNGIGIGQRSHKLSAKPVAVPGVPAIADVTAGDGQAVVSFSAPFSTGGSPIAGYRVIPSPAGGVDGDAGSTRLAHTITGLTNGTTYTFSVVASNAVGDSALSAPSHGVVPATAPAQIVAKSVAGNASAVLSFATPSDNGAPLVSYRIEITHAGSDAVVLTVDATNGAKAVSGRLAATVVVNGGNTGIRIGGLHNGRVYGLTVAASNRVATGQPSAKVSAKPLTVPGVPAIQSVEAGNSEARVVFSAPASSGGSAVTGYTVVSSPAGGVDADAGSMSLTHTITGLSNGTAYTFAVAAINAVGAGPSSAASMPVVPQAPQPVFQGPVASADALAMETVILKAPLVQVEPVRNVAPRVPQAISQSSATHVDSPAMETVILRAPFVPVRTAGDAVPPATVAVSTGDGDAVSWEVTDTGKPSFAETKAEAAPMPGTSAIVSVLAGDAQAKVRFSPPATSGGGAITGYTVISDPAGGVDIHAGITSLTHTITGLTNGTDYTFTVIATNAAGNSVSSAPSASVTPATVPAQPGVNAMPGDGRIVLDFITPADNGAALTAYTVEVSSPGSGTSHITLNAADNSTATAGNFVATLSISGRNTRITVTGLVNGKTYCFTIAASNRVGLGAVSENVVAKPVAAS